VYERWRVYSSVPNGGRIVSTDYVPPEPAVIHRPGSPENPLTFTEKGAAMVAAIQRNAQRPDRALFREAMAGLLVADLDGKDVTLSAPHARALLYWLERATPERSA
jgi:hypothetical protein